MGRGFLVVPQQRRVGRQRPAFLCETFIGLPETCHSEPMRRISWAIQNERPVPAIETVRPVLTRSPNGRGSERRSRRWNNRTHGKPGDSSPRAQNDNTNLPRKTHVLLTRRGGACPAHVRLENAPIICRDRPRHPVRRRNGPWSARTRLHNLSTGPR